jgi:RNA polymerase sigma-B factor
VSDASGFPAPGSPSCTRRAGPDRDTRARHLLAGAAQTSDPQQRRDMLDTVVLLHLEVADSVASRYRNRGITEDDLRQAAYEGLVKATHRFDPCLRHDFLSYAVPTMRGEVQRFFRDHGWMVRPPRRTQELQWQLARTRDRLTGRLGRDPSVEELVTELDVSPTELSEAEQAHGSFRVTSLDQPLGEGDAGTLGDLIETEWTDLRAAEARLMLEPVLCLLGERDLRLLHLRYIEDCTQQQIGKELGISQMQVSRHLSRIIRTLRQAIDGGGPLQATA